MDADVNKGKAAEDRLHLSAKRSFFSDFVFKTPLYRKGSGIREAGDALVWLDEDLIIFQSKARSLATRELCLPYSGREMNWATKNLRKAIRQLDGTRRALMDRQVKTLVNERRGEVEFEPTTVRRVHGVVIMAQMVNFYDPLPLFPKRNGADLAVHVFTLSEWPKICSEFSTTPDFVAYLRFRERLIGRMPLLVGREKDLVAWYILQKREPKELDQIPDIAGLGDWFGENFENELAARKHEDRWSLLIDDVIDHLHDADPMMKDLVDFPKSGPQDYSYTAMELSKLTRLERRMVGRKFADKIRLAGEGDCLRYFASLGQADLGVLVLASPEPREKRVRHLAVLSAMAKHQLKVTTMVGIATEAGFGRGRSYDTCYLKFPWREDVESDRNSAGLFSEPQHSQETEFPDMTDVSTGGPVYS